MTGVFVRENNVHYLKIDSGSGKGLQHYAMKMLVHNTVWGLLETSVRSIDNHLVYYYRMDAFRPLSMVYQNSEFPMDRFEKLLQSLDRCCEHLKEFMLDCNGLLLEEEYIFVSPDKENFRFVFYLADSGEDRDFLADLRKLYEKVMEHISHEDRVKTMRFYEAYQMLCRNATLKEVIQILGEGREHNASGQTGHREQAAVIPTVVTEEVENDAEKEILDVRAYIPVCKGVIAVIAGVLVLSQIFSGSLPFAIPQGIIFGAAAVLVALYVLLCVGQRIFAQPITKIVHSKEQIPYSVTRDEMEELPQAQINEGDGFKEEFAVQAKPQEEYRTQLLSELIEKTFVIELKGSGAAKGENIVIGELPCTVGSMFGNADVKLSGEYISRLHAKLTEEGEHIYIEDMLSANGTYVNGRRLEPQEKCALREGDTLRFARTDYNVSI